MVRRFVFVRSSSRLSGRVIKSKPFARELVAEKSQDEKHGSGHEM